MGPNLLGHSLNALLYQIKKEEKTLLLYIEKKENETEKGKLRFVKEMFLPVGYDLRVFWRYHFGIIGVEGAMQMDEIALY